MRRQFINTIVSTGRSVDLENFTEILKKIKTRKIER